MSMTKKDLAPDRFKRLDYLAYNALARGINGFTLFNTYYHLEIDKKHLKDAAIISWKQKKAGLYYGALSSKQIQSIIDL